MNNLFLSRISSVTLTSNSYQNLPDMHKNILNMRARTYTHTHTHTHTHTLIYIDIYNNFFFFFFVVISGGECYSNHISVGYAVFSKRLLVFEEDVRIE